jgi:hypothetical protein
MYTILTSCNEDYLETLLGEIYETLLECSLGSESYFGVYYSGIKPRICNSTYNYPNLYRLLKELGEHFNIAYTTILVFRRAIGFYEITGGYMNEPSAIISLGEYSGGELILKSKNNSLVSLSSLGKLIQFVPKNTQFSEQPHNGTKFTIYFYINKHIVKYIRDLTKKI